ELLAGPAEVAARQVQLPGVEEAVRVVREGPGVLLEQGQQLLRPLLLEQVPRQGPEGRRLVGGGPVAFQGQPRVRQGADEPEEVSPPEVIDALLPIRLLE